MKVKFLAMAAIAAATVMTTSCSSDEAVSNSDERVEVKFSSTEASIETRVADNNWAVNDPIGIYMIKETPGTLADPNILEGVNNRQYKASAATTGGDPATFQQVGGTIYYPVSGDVKFIAYYPYSSSISGEFKRDIDLSLQGDQSAIDFLYAPAGTAYSKTSGTASLPFVHKLVKLVFNIGKEDASVTAALNGLTVAITGQSTTGSLNLTDGTVATINSGQTIQAKVATDGTSAEAIVFPQEVAGKNFTFTNSIGETFTGAIPGNLTAANKYTYTVTLKKNEVGISGTIANWDNGGSGAVVAE